MLVAVVYLLTQMRLASARNAILDKLEESTGTLREMLAEQLREETNHAFSKARELLEPLQNETATVEEDAAQRMERLRRLGDSLESLATDAARLGQGG
jgi:predicted nuclease with TOPRIM domain